MAKGINFNLDTTKSEFQNPMVELRQGDGNYQSLHVTITSNGEPLDLTGWTITFMGTTNGLHKVVDSSSVVENAVQGTFNYTPTKAWGQDMGEYKKAYFKFTNGDQSASSANFRVTVFEAVDLTEEEAGNYISVVDQLIDKVKSDMDSKLYSTQKTLSDTQSQATTVQKHVEDLNTNVNNLVSQNNNIKSTDNIWTGNNTFSKQINGSLATRDANFKDFSDVAKNMASYSGNWRVQNTPVANSPISGSGFYTTEIVNYGANGGRIAVYYIGGQGNYINNVSGGVLGTWFKIANDAQLVHNTGTETVAGDKTFTGSNTFTKTINGNALTATFATSAKSTNVYTPTDTDANNLKLNGTYFFSGTNLPNSVNAFYVQVFLGSNGAVKQIACRDYDNAVYVRTFQNSSWNSWSQIIASDLDNTFSGNVSFNGTANVNSTLTINGATSINNTLTINGVDYAYQNVSNLTVSGYVGGTLYLEKINGTVYIGSNNFQCDKGATVTLPSGFLPKRDQQFVVGGLNSSGTTASGYGTVSTSGKLTINSMGFATGSATAYINTSYISQ